MKKQIITVLHFYYEMEVEQIKLKRMRKKYPNEKNVVLFAHIKMEDEKIEKEKPEKVKKLTFKERTKIARETKANRTDQLMLPPPAYTNIMPAPKLRTKNYVDIVSYVDDKYPRILALTEYDDVNPSVATVEGISDELRPLAGLERGNITNAQKETRDTLYNDLITYFTAMINDCVNLSAGNALLFALTGVSTKRVPVRNRQQLPATVFKLNVKKGRGKVGVSCKKVKYAKSYTVYYGPGMTYDPATWKLKVGTSRILITDLTPGTLVYFVMVANSGTTEGHWTDALFTNWPFN